MPSSLPARSTETRSGSSLIATAHLGEIAAIQNPDQFGASRLPARDCMCHFRILEIRGAYLGIRDAPEGGFSETANGTSRSVGKKLPVQNI